MKLYNSIRIDGSLFLTRGDRMVWSVYLPAWLTRAYCRCFGVRQ